MKNLFYVLTVFTFLLASCGSDNSSNKGKAIAPETIQLICQPLKNTEATTDMPRFEVFIQIGDSKVKVDEILDCKPIAPEDYAQYQIPENAITAVGGWWAGSGDYIYVVEEDGKYLVKQGTMDEEQADTDFDYHTVLTFSK